MLVKSHCNEFLDEFGLVSQDRRYIHFMDGSVVNNSNKLKLSPVIRANARWMYKDIKVKCKIADTVSKKRIGLQGCCKLESNEGMYFPYLDYTDVTFHQGSVPFSLDIIFLRDFKIIGMKERTKVGSYDKWECFNCDGVIEVNGGFCKANSVCDDDQILVNTISERDVVELEQEQINGQFDDDSYEIIGVI